MTNDDDLLTSLLDDLPGPSLPPALATRVLAIARTELAPAPAEVRAGARFRLAVTGAVIPALLASATVVRTTETVEVAAKVFAGRD